MCLSFISTARSVHVYITLACFVIINIYHSVVILFELHLYTLQGAIVILPEADVSNSRLFLNLLRDDIIVQYLLSCVTHSIFATHLLFNKRKNQNTNNPESYSEKCLSPRERQEYIEVKKMTVNKFSQEVL